MILCFDDHSDGKAYLTAVKDWEYLNIINLAPYMIYHDHVCIVEDDIYYKYGDADFSTYAPYAITLEMGEKVNVNKL